MKKQLHNSIKRSVARLKGLKVTLIIAAEQTECDIVCRP